MGVEVAEAETQRDVLVVEAKMLKQTQRHTLTEMLYQAKIMHGRLGGEAVEAETPATQRYMLSQVSHEAKVMHEHLGGEAVGAVTRVHLHLDAMAEKKCVLSPVKVV